MLNKKVIILGNGFIADHLPYEKYTRYLPADDLTFEAKVIDRYNPDVVINCIGKTGKPNVDWCETHREETSLTNTALPIILAKVCAKKSIHFIQIGSGCIYFGKSPNYYLERHGDPHYNEDIVMKVDSGWKETDFANPQSYYSKSKYACDLAIGDMSNVATLRIRMPVSEKNTPRNLINKLKGYSRLIDIPNSMTFMTDFTRCVEWIIKKSCTGVYHITNPGTLSAARIMTEYQKYVPEHNFSILSEQELDKLTLAKRSNCVLNTDKLQTAGFTMTPAENALENCMKNFV